MDRRTFLTATATAAGGFALSGCLGGNTQSNPTPSEDTPIHPLSEPVTHNGIKVSVTDYTTADKYFEYPYHYRASQHTEAENKQFYDQGDPNYETPPTAGGVFLLAHLVVENTGDTRHYFPDPEQMVLTYNGDETQTFHPTASIRANDTNYESYSARVSESGAAKNGAYPGFKIGAWMVFEVPASFHPEDTVIHIPWSGGDAETVTHGWRLSTG